MCYNMFAEKPNNAISTYISNCLGCGCGCAGHTSYFLIYNNDVYYEYIFDARMKFGSSSEYSYRNIKPNIKQILILQFYEFYEIFYEENEKLLKIIDNYWNDKIMNKKYYDIFTCDETKFEYTIDIAKCLKCYQQYCKNLVYDLKKYDDQEILDKIQFNLEQENIDMSCFIIQQEFIDYHNKNEFFYFNKN